MSELPREVPSPVGPWARLIQLKPAGGGPLFRLLLLTERRPKSSVRSKSNMLPSGGSLYNVDVNVELTPDQRVFIQKAIESGRFSREEEAVQEALALWEERKRLEILAMLDEADVSLARGEGREITEQSMKALAEEAKQRLRRRPAAEERSILD